MTKFWYDIVASGICHTDIDMIDYWDSARIPVGYWGMRGQVLWNRSVRESRA